MFVAVRRIAGRCTRRLQLNCQKVFNRVGLDLRIQFPSGFFAAQALEKELFIDLHHAQRSRFDCNEIGRERADSCLIQDEPETGIGFSHKMSLKGGIGMLGIDHQHGRFGSDEPGADPGVSGGQRRSSVRRTATRRGVRLDGTDAGAASVYARLSRREKGLVRRYLARMTGLSRAQMTRLIAGYADTGRVKAVPYRRRKFAARYTKADVDLLAYVDKRHGNLSGPATKRILEREYGEYGQSAYKRLAGISVAQIYRFRNSEAYRKRNTSYQPTRPTPIPIGERRKPRPQGRPGYLRIDTVHQGDRDGVKGIYHINAVDEVTQWEIVAAAPQISEYWLIPLLEQLLQQFPFTIRGFHSDNGSEFINYTVARLLDKLLIEQTKSRAHRTGDNGLVESKNGAIIRKHMGFGHIARAACRSGRPVSSPSI